MTDLKVWLVLFAMVPVLCSIHGLVKGADAAGNIKYLTSPNYPNNYPDNQHITQTLTVEHGSSILVTFQDFQIESHSSCDYDYVQFCDGNKKCGVKLCGTGSFVPQEFTIDTSMATVVFHSDDSGTPKGYKLSYQSATTEATAIINEDLPEFIWNDPYNINIKFPNGKKESIPLILASDLENACVLEGETSETSLIITSPSSSDGCHSLNQHSEITLRSTHLQKNTVSPIQKIKAIYFMKNGKLQEIDEHIFGINEESRKRDVSKMEVPKKIQMPIQFGYDLGLLNKFNKYGQGKSYIRKRIQQLFLASKMSLHQILNHAKFELILEKNIIYINEELKMTNSVLLKSRKYQVREDIPIIILCAEDYDNKIKGLSFRSGACRKDKERYGVAMMVWRDDGGLAADVLEHEIGHLIGGVHNEKNEKETDVGHSDFNSNNVHFWFNVSGSRCYGKYCSHPPTKPHGRWSCDKDYHECDLKCDPGFATVFSKIKCENGKWSESINNIGCSPSVLLLVGGGGIKGDVEVYDPTTGSVSCTNLPPSLDLDWTQHTSFIHHGTVYMCGGHKTKSICISINSQINTWRQHTLLSSREGGHSSVVMDNTLYLIGGIGSTSLNAEAVSTPLPLTDPPVLTAVSNLSYKGRHQCTVKIDQDSFAIIGGYSSGYLQDVTRYKIADGTTETLSPIEQARSSHGCVMLEVNTKLWIIVTGGDYEDCGWKCGQTTEVLDITDTGNVWNFIGNLNVARTGHGMAVTERGVMVIGGLIGGGWTSLQSVEVLNWTTGQWKLITQILTKARCLFGGIVEIPTELFGCDAYSITRDTNADCSFLPSKQNGKWSCDNTNAKCSLICEPGFVSLYTTTTCIRGGIWKEMNKIECLPSVLLLAGGNGNGDENDIEVYNPTTGHVSCSNQPPPLVLDWYGHTSFTHHGTVYMCGGINTRFICISIDSQLNTWRKHSIASLTKDSSSIVMDYTLFLIGGLYYSSVWDYSEAVSTPLPLTDKPVLTTVPNLSYKGKSPCTVKIDHDSLAITGGNYFQLGGALHSVTRYNVVYGTTETLSPMQQARSSHGCVMLEVDTKLQIIVTGGVREKTTEILDITDSENVWNYIGDLNVIRQGHGMAVTERGVVAMGGDDSSWNYLKSVELLDWESGKWQLIEPSLTKTRSLFGGVVEIPAQLFGCQTQSIIITDCDGEYEYNQEYKGGDVMVVPEDQTCHSVCGNEDDCKAWTWTAQEQCRIIGNGNSLETIKLKTGSISGLKNSCKPKCYLVLGPQEEASTNTQFCTHENTETGCSNMIHMEPDDFQEGDTILVCHELQEDGKIKRVCESISYNQVHLVCNPQPATVTLQSWKNVGKHDRHFRDARSMFSKWGRRG